jgi:hypothetical protein
VAQTRSGFFETKPILPHPSLSKKEEGFSKRILKIIKEGMECFEVEEVRRNYWS